MGVPAAGGIISPTAGQVQLSVDERPPRSAGIGEKDADLAVVDLAGGARVLALHPHRGRALLEKAGLVHHQHRARIAQVLDHLAAQIIPDQVGIPVGGGQQPLHPIRGGLAGVLGQLPAVFPCHGAPAVRADTPAPADAARPGRTDPRCGPASPPAPPPTPALPRSLLSPIGVRHGPSPSWRSALPAPSLPASGEPYLKTSAA